MVDYVQKATRCFSMDVAVDNERRERVVKAASEARCGDDDKPPDEPAPLSIVIERLVNGFLLHARRLVNDRALANRRPPAPDGTEGAAEIDAYVAKIASYVGCVYFTAKELAARIEQIFPANSAHEPVPAQESFAQWTSRCVHVGANTLFDDVAARSSLHRHFATRALAINDENEPRTSIFAPLALFAFKHHRGQLTNEPAKLAFYLAVKAWLYEMLSVGVILDRRMMTNATPWNALRNPYKTNAGAMLDDHAQLVERLAAEIVLVDVSRFGFAPAFCNPRRVCVDGQVAPVQAPGTPYFNEALDVIQYSQPPWEQFLDAPQWAVMDTMSRPEFIASRMNHLEHLRFDPRPFDTLLEAANDTGFAVFLENNVAALESAKSAQSAISDAARSGGGAQERVVATYRSEGILWMMPLLGAIDHRMRLAVRGEPQFEESYQASTSICELREIVLKLVSVPANSRARWPFSLHFECMLAESSRLKIDAESKIEAVEHAVDDRNSLARNVVENAQDSLSNDNRQIERLSNPNDPNNLNDVVVTSGVGVAAAALIHDDVYVRGRLVLEMDSAAAAESVVNLMSPENSKTWLNAFVVGVLQRWIAYKSVTSLTSTARDVRVQCISSEAGGTQLVVLVQVDVTECVHMRGELRTDDENVSVGGEAHVVDELVRRACGVSPDRLVGTRHATADAAVSRAVTRALKASGPNEVRVPRLVVLRSHWWLCGDLGNAASETELKDDASFSPRVPTSMTLQQFHLAGRNEDLNQSLIANKRLYERVLDDATATLNNLQDTRKYRARCDANAPKVSHPSYQDLSVDAAALFLDHFLRGNWTKRIGIGEGNAPYAVFAPDEQFMGVRTLDQPSVFFDPTAMYEFRLYMQHALTMAGCLYDATLDTIRFDHTRRLREHVFATRAGPERQLPPAIGGPLDARSLFDTRMLIHMSSEYYYDAIKALRSIERDDDERWRQPAPLNDATKPLHELGRVLTLLGHYTERARAFANLLEQSTDYVWKARGSGVLARAVTTRLSAHNGHTHHAWDRYRLGHARVADALRSCAGAVTAGWTNALDIKNKLIAAINEVQALAKEWDSGANGALFALAAVVVRSDVANDAVKSMARDTMKIVELVHATPFSRAASTDMLECALDNEAMLKWTTDCENLSIVAAHAYKSTMIASTVGCAGFRELHHNLPAESAPQQRAQADHARAFDVSSAFVEMSEIEAYMLYLKTERAALKEEGFNSATFTPSQEFLNAFRNSHVLAHSRLLYPGGEAAPDTDTDTAEGRMQATRDRILLDTPFRKRSVVFSNAQSGTEEVVMFDEADAARALS